MFEENIEIKINNKKIPLNNFMRKLFTGIILTLVELLKGIEEDIEKIEITTSKS